MSATPTESTLIYWKDRLQDRVRELTERNEEQVYLVLTLVIGALVGLVVVAFILTTEDLGRALYPQEGGTPWRRVLVPVLGALVTGLLLFFSFPEARGSGIPQTKAALYARGGRITLRTVFGKFLCSSTSLASGIALGREGPSVQIGAGIASVLGRTLGLPREKIQSLIVVGAAAALAAAFNTPIAAVLFALEEVVGNLHAPVLGSIVLGSATSWLVLRLMLGDEPLFHVPEYQVVHPVEFVIYAFLGLIGGLVSVVFVKTLLKLREKFLSLPRNTRWVQPAVGGLVVGVLSLAVPEVLGVGYGYVSEALNGQLAIQLMAILVVLKLIAVTTSYASGNAGGIFGPSLFIGAMVGGTVGSVAHTFAPEFTATPGAYALVGMGTAFAGILRVPMTSVIMIFEITHDYAIIVPVMISNLISFLVSRRLQRQPIYEALSLQDGIHLPTVATGQRHLQVRLAMHAPTDVLSPQMTVAEAREKASHSKSTAWPVADEKGVWGVLSLLQLNKAAEKGELNSKISAIVDSRNFPHVHADHSLDLALERMGETGFDVLPVVSRANVHELEGVVGLLDVLRAFGVRERRPPD
ncbi:MAG TPA: chloride channel protein [Vicinamibacteria bacterium]|jgi:CIC family chloride channel protein